MYFWKYIWCLLNFGDIRSLLVNDTRPTHYAHAHQGNIKVQIFTAYQFDACHYISILGENPSEEVDDDDDEIDNYYYCIMNKSQETTVFHGRQKLTCIYTIKIT